MFKFIHAADLHIDSPLRGLDRYEGCPADRIRGASRRAVENLVELAIEENVAFVLLAGDLYDGEWADHNTGLWFVRQMARLNEAGIPVVCIKGNHDAESKIPSHLHLPANVRELSSKGPETVRLDDWNVAIHGQGFRTAKVLDNLAEAYPAAERGWFNIGLLHTCADGREGHDRYSPCPVDLMRSKRFGYDYWALGHIHKREILHPFEPFVAFPGNIQGRHVREEGPKGALLVEVGDDGRPSAAFKPLDVFRWRVCGLDAENLDDVDALVEQFGGRLAELVKADAGLPLAVRVEIRGRTPLHAKLNGGRAPLEFKLKGTVGESFGDAVWIEKIDLRTAPPREANADLAGSVGELVDLIREVREDANALRLLVGEEIADLRKKLEQEIRDADALLGLTDESALTLMLDQVEAQLLDRLS